MAGVHGQPEGRFGRCARMRRRAGTGSLTSGGDSWCRAWCHRGPRRPPAHTRCRPFHCLEVVATLAGLLLGLPTAGQTTVYDRPHTGRPVSRAEWAYAFLWIVAVGARAAFSYGSVHWFHDELERCMVDNCVAAAGIADSLLLMAVAMTLTRTVSLPGRVSAVRHRAFGHPVACRGTSLSPEQRRSAAAAFHMSGRRNVILGEDRLRTDSSQPDARIRERQIASRKRWRGHGCATPGGPSFPPGRS